MPSFKTPGIGGEFRFLKECGMEIVVEHLKSGQSAKFLGSLTNFADQYTSDWNEEIVYGRMDPISTFRKTSRRINISWVVLNESPAIGRQNMEEFAKLINFTYPAYNDAGGGGAGTISSGPLLKLKFTNLAAHDEEGGLLGYLGGIQFAPNLDAGWVSFKDEDISAPEIGIPVVTGRTELIPQEFEVSCEFTVLHRNKLGWNEHGGPRSSKFPYGRTHTEGKPGSAPDGTGTQPTSGPDTPGGIGTDGTQPTGGRDLGGGTGGTGGRGSGTSTQRTQKRNDAMDLRLAR